MTKGWQVRSIPQKQQMRQRTRASHRPLFWRKIEKAHILAIQLQAREKGKDAKRRQTGGRVEGVLAEQRGAFTYTCKRGLPTSSLWALIYICEYAHSLSVTLLWALPYA